MSRILVVDDSPLDRQIIGGLLAKSGYSELFYAEDGVAAMATIGEIDPDLVLTDLLMPNMGGLELVNELKQNYPSIPVVLMTSDETEGVALRALKEGAASYVPKKRLALDLPETVAGVLGASREQRQKAQAMMRLNRWEADFTIEPDMNLIMTVSAYLMQNFAAMDLCAGGEQVRVGVALAEALQNAFFHGCLELPRGLRDSNRDEYAKLAESRTKESPYKERRIHVSARLSRGQAIFSIRDDGKGFDVSKALNPFETPSYSRSTFFWSGFGDTRLPGTTNPVPMEPSVGRGLMLMRTLMDEVKFNEPGNQVTLVKNATKTVPLMNKATPSVVTAAAPTPATPTSVASKPVQNAETVERVIAKSAPAIAKPGPVAAPREVISAPEPVEVKSKPVALRPEPVVVKPQPVMVPPEPAVSTPELPPLNRLQIANTPDPIPAKTDAPLPKPLQISSKPVLRSKPLPIATKHVSILSKPVAKPGSSVPPAPVSPTNGDAQETARRDQEASPSEQTMTLVEDKPTNQTPDPGAADQPLLSIKSRKVMVH